MGAAGAGAGARAPWGQTGKAPRWRQVRAGCRRARCSPAAGAPVASRSSQLLPLTFITRSQSSGLPAKHGGQGRGCMQARQRHEAGAPTLGPCLCCRAGPGPRGRHNPTVLNLHPSSHGGGRRLARGRRPQAAGCCPHQTHPSAAQSPPPCGCPGCRHCAKGAGPGTHAILTRTRGQLRRMSSRPPRQSALAQQAGGQAGGPLRGRRA